MISVFFGPPGSGKGTQVQRITQNDGCVWISTGNMLRSEIASQSPLGGEIKEIIEDGGFISDDIVLEMFEKELEKHLGKNLILDGIPRTLAQAKVVDQILAKHDMKVNFVVEFNLDNEKLLQRILGRYSCKDCGATYHKIFNPTKVEGKCDYCGGLNLRVREDDKEEVLKKRLELYYLETLPILGYYKEHNVLHRIDAALSPHAVADLIGIILKKANKGE